MELIKQINRTTCGQACIAMFLEFDIDTAIDMIGHDGITSDAELTVALEAGCETNLVFQSGTPPTGCIAIQKHEEPNGKRAHWTLWDRDKLLDPACIGPRLWPVSRYAILVEEGKQALAEVCAEKGHDITNMLHEMYGEKLPRFMHVSCGWGGDDLTADGKCPGCDEDFPPP